MIENDGHECTTTNEILKSQKTYYKTLYSEKNVTNDNPIASAIGENHIKLYENESESLEGILNIPDKKKETHHLELFNSQEDHK